jgi:hypothetical protein
MHEFEAFRCLLCLIQGVFMEILQGGRQIWCANRRRKKVVGRRKRTGGEEDLFFVLDLGLVGAFVFGLGHQKISGPKFPLGRQVPAH